MNQQDPVWGESNDQEKLFYGSVWVQSDETVNIISSKFNLEFITERFDNY